MAGVRDASCQAHHRLLSDGTIDRSMLRAPVAAAWERCRSLGANPRLARVGLVVPQERKELIARYDTVISIGDGYATILSNTLAPLSSAVMIADPEGTVLLVRGHDRCVSGHRGVPGPGALLAEGTAGANAVGTCAAEKAWSQYAGAEHFILGLHRFASYAVPVHGPDDDVLCVMSIWVRRPQTVPGARSLLACAALGMEAELGIARLGKDLWILTHAELDAELLDRIRRGLIGIDAVPPSSLWTTPLPALELQSRLLLNGARASLVRLRREERVWRELVSPVQHGALRSGVRTVASEMIGLLRRSAARMGVALASAGAGPDVQVADTANMRHELLALLLGAMDHAGRGGAVCVEPGADGERARIAVRATRGRGEPEPLEQCMWLPAIRR